MSIRPDEERKGLATALAESLASGKAGQAQIMQLFEQLGYKLPDGAGSSAGSNRQTTNGAIGIYEPQLVGGNTYYYRSATAKARWERFADVDCIPPKGTGKRVVLLGESVARGFLLDPDYTPAHILRTLLSSNNIGEEFEVVDLAETNLSMDGLWKRYQECMALQPDMIVLFAGNNWRTDIEIKFLNDRAALEKVARELPVQQHIAGLKPAIEEVFAAMIDTFLAGLRAQATGNVKLLFVIPEFNLMDYRSTPGERAITRLSGNNTRHWIYAMQEATAAAATGDNEKIQLHAANMIALDPTHPLGYEFLADYKLATQDIAGARADLETARDCSLYFRTNSKPRIYKVIRDTIRDRAPVYGVNVIDLPAVFSTYQDGQLPDRRLFFDYCHLTAEGLQVAMEAVARQVLTDLYGKEVTPGTAVQDIQPAPDANSRAHMLAAIHNAHWGQRGEILHYHCTKALQFSPQMGENMIRYCDMVTRKTANVLCTSYRELLTAFKHSRHIHAFRSHEKMKGMELPLMNAMSAALKTTGKDIDGTLHALRSREHAMTDVPVNLLDSYYHVSSFDNFQGTKAAYFQSREPVSHFLLPGTTHPVLALELTLRAPSMGAQQGKALIWVNNFLLSEVTVSGSWKDQQIQVKSHYLRRDMNELRIEWPVPAGKATPQDWQLTFTGPSANVLLDKVYHVFGEMIRCNAVKVPAH